MKERRLTHDNEYKGMDVLQFKKQNVGLDKDILECIHDRMTDMLMKYADILPPFFEIEFPNKQYIYTQIWRGKIQSPEEPLQNEEPVKEETPTPPVKQWTDREKLEIALLGSNPAWTIDELCRTHGITKEMYYKWSAQLSNALPKIFECGGEDPSGKQGLETSKPRA